MLGEEDEAVTVCLLKCWVFVLPEKCLHHLGQEDFAALRIVFSSLGCWSSCLVLLGHQGQDRFCSFEHDLVPIFMGNRECLLQASDQHDLSGRVALVALLFHIDGKEIECSNLEVSELLLLVLILLWTTSFYELLGQGSGLVGVLFAIHLLV